MHYTPQDLLFDVLHMHVDPKIAIFKICYTKLLIYERKFSTHLDPQRVMKLFLDRVWMHICILLFKTFHLVCYTCM